MFNSIATYITMVMYVCSCTVISLYTIHWTGGTDYRGFARECVLCRNVTLKFEWLQNSLISFNTFAFSAIFEVNDIGRSITKATVITLIYVTMCQVRMLNFITY